MTVVFALSKATLVFSSGLTPFLSQGVGLVLLGGREVDLHRALKTVGIANSAAGLVGGMPGYHVAGMSNLARRVGLHGAAAGRRVASVSALCLFLGATVLADLPRGLIAAVLWCVGFDLLLTALWDYRRRIPDRDKAFVLAIPLIAVTLGVLPALARAVAERLIAATLLLKDADI